LNAYLAGLAALYPAEKAVAKVGGEVSTQLIAHDQEVGNNIQVDYELLERME